MRTLAVMIGSMLAAATIAWGAEPTLPTKPAGKVVGAIGVSGNTPQEDEDIAKAGAAAFAAP